MASYVALGFPMHNGWSQEPPAPMVLAVSRDVGKINTFVDGLRDVTQQMLHRGSLSPVYVHAGVKYSSVEVIGPVPDLDGSPVGVIIADTVGTINM